MTNSRPLTEANRIATDMPAATRADVVAANPLVEIEQELAQVEAATSTIACNFPLNDRSERLRLLTLCEGGDNGNFDDLGDAMFIVRYFYCKVAELDRDPEGRVSLGPAVVLIDDQKNSWFSTSRGLFDMLTKFVDMVGIGAFDELPVFRSTTTRTKNGRTRRSLEFVEFYGAMSEKDRQTIHGNEKRGDVIDASNS